MDSPTSPDGGPRSEAFGGVPPSSRIPPESKPWPTWLRVLLPLLIFAIGGGIAAALVLTKPDAEQKERPKAALPVEVQAIRVGEHAVVVRAQGTVRAAEQLVLQPEITGRITWLADELVLGGRLKKGQPLVRIDPRDYQLAVRQQQAQVGNQALALRVEKARQDVAQEEWELYQRERRERDKQRGKAPKPSEAKRSDADAGAPSPDGVLEQGELALREPQVQSAEISLQSARSGLSRARQLAYLALPSDGKPGSPARVTLQAGGQTVERQGYIVRLLGDLDPVGRMARVLVEIDDPLGLDKAAAKAPGAAAPKPGAPSTTLPSGGDSTGNGETSLPLLLGSFVRVEIRGKTIANVAEIPTRALQSQDRVFLLGADDQLQIRSVEVLLRSAETTVVRGALSAGDRIVVTAISAPVEGMQLRVLSPEAAPSTSAGPSAAPTASAAADSSAKPAPARGGKP